MFEGWEVGWGRGSVAECIREVGRGSKKVHKKCTDSDHPVQPHSFTRTFIENQYI